MKKLTSNQSIENLLYNASKLETKKAFTLVELIIVITILGILSTIAFMSMSEYLVSSRDANRITQIKEIYQGLKLSAIKTVTYPKPEGYVEIQGVSFQGYVGENTIKRINMLKLPKDPKDESQYLYSINNKKRKAQLGIFLESGETKVLGLHFVQETYAEKLDYSERHLYTLGDKVGIFTNEENIPIQETYTGIIDLSTNSGTFIVQFSNNSSSGVITGSGQDLLTNISIIQSACILDGTVINSGDQIVAYKLKNTTYPEVCEGVQRECSNTLLSGNELYKYASCTDGAALNCTTTSQSGYTIPVLNHNQTQNVTKPVSYGTGDINVSCNNGVLSYGNENINCQGGYVLQGGSCIPDICPSTPPSYSVVNGTQSITGTWNHNTTPGVCTYVCQVGYYFQGGNCIEIINGTCGTSSGSTFASAPTTNLCNSGTPSIVSGLGPWTWTCNGSGGGTNANCSANIFTYSRNIGGWGSCSASCGGGTQSRSITCKRSDTTIVSDAFCIGPKPTTSQSCNTGGCPCTGKTVYSDTFFQTYTIPSLSHGQSHSTYWCAFDFHYTWTCNNGVRSGPNTVAYCAA